MQPIPKIPSLIHSKTIVKLNEITFKYPTATRPALKNISVSFERGKRYAFVGPSGGGKSTLMEILMGLLEPSSGSLTWFVDSGEIFSYVPQDIQVSTTSLQNNVALEWDESAANSKEVANALLNSSFITNEQHLLTNSALRVDTISGGEKQRLALARALYDDPQLLILDEPNSHLDEKGELALKNSIIKMKENKSLIIIVTHKKNILEIADVILTIDNGKLIEV
jgi:ABC-type protease/lipase transport system fused ATPase/permease subunit